MRILRSLSLFLIPLFFTIGCAGEDPFQVGDALNRGVVDAGVEITDGQDVDGGELKEFSFFFPGNFESASNDITVQVPTTKGVVNYRCQLLWTMGGAETQSFFCTPGQGAKNVNPLEAPNGDGVAETDL